METHKFSIYAGRTFSLSDHGFVWSDYHDAWLHENDATHTQEDGYVHNDEVCCCEHTGDPICGDDNRSEYMVRIEDLDQWWSLVAAGRDAYQHESGDWYSEPEERGGLLDYHEGYRDIRPASESRPYRIGMEVEKEDEDYRQKLEDETQFLADGWVAERDGSLNDSTGFELVSPAYNLADIDDIETDLVAMKGILGADSSPSCGGHISISDKRYSTTELAKRIRPLFPLLMALYPKRLRTDYCKPAKDKHKQLGEKYRAFAFFEKRIELRIISAVKNHEQLLWRIKLIKMFLDAAMDKPVDWAWMRSALSKNGALRQHLLDGYKHLPETERKAKVASVITLYKAFSGWYYNDHPISDSIAAYMTNYDEPYVPQPQPERSRALSDAIDSIIAGTMVAEAFTSAAPQWVAFDPVQLTMHTYPDTAVVSNGIANNENNN